MDKPTAQKLIADYEEGEAAAFREYVQLVRERDAYRRQAEIYQKMMKKEWCKYYEAEKRILKLQEELAIDIDECPPAPKKTKITKF